MCVCVCSVVLLLLHWQKIMDKDTQKLLVTVKHIIAVYTGKPQEAEDLEQNALKIIMKV